MLTDVYVMDKRDGIIHKVGENQHDSLWVDTEGIVHYYNLQNGDGCEGNGYENGKEDGYAFVPYNVEFGEFSQPENCIIQPESVCGYPIEDCKNCPIRTGIF